MPRVCDFHFSQVVYQWVVDRGMKLFDPFDTIDHHTLMNISEKAFKTIDSFD